MSGGALPRLGLLDFGDADVLAIAPVADELGFSRVWLAEHQSKSALYADALLMTMGVAAITRRARVGPGGLLLRFRSPLSIANGARLLDSIFPGRIDLGLAAGTTSEPELAALLDGRADYRDREDHRRRVRSVVAMLRNQSIEKAAPSADEAPAVWFLDSSGSSASFAGSIGAGYALSLMHNAELPPSRAIAEYRASFVPSASMPRPEAIVALAIQCGAGPLSPRIGAGVHNPVVGSIEACREAMLAIAARYDVDELMVLDLDAEPEERLRILRELAAAFELPARVT